MFDWAFEALPPFLDPNGQGDLEQIRSRWEGALLERLSKGDDDLFVLVALEGRTWHASLSQRVQALRDERLAGLDRPACIRFGEAALESGLLRIAEVEEAEPEACVGLLTRERERVLVARDRLAAALEAEGVAKSDSAGKVLVRRLGRLARRLHNEADEALLVHRLEGRFGRTWVRLFSRFTFGCLILLLALLFAGLFTAPGSQVDQALLWIDTGICFVFLWELAVRVAFAPRRHVWFARHFVTDFLPSLPFGLLVILATPAGAAGTFGAEFWVRTVRVARFPAFARYVRFLRPLVVFVRLVLFAIRGMDRLVPQLRPILNRDIILFEPEVDPVEVEDTGEGFAHEVTHAFIRLPEAMRREEAPRLVATVTAQIEAALAEGLGDVFTVPALAEGVGTPAMRAETAIAVLETLRAEDVERILPRETLATLGRLLKVSNVPPIRWLPFLGPLVRASRGSTSADRIAHAARGLAGYCATAISWARSWADLTGVLTAPQVLDRIATLLVKSTQGPALRLLLFGGLFLLLKLGFEIASEDMHSWVGEFLDKFVATPLLVLGSVCLALLLLAHWTKHLAGQASEELVLASEARYGNLLELQRSHEEDTVVAEVARCVLLEDPDEREALQAAMRRGLCELRGEPDGVGGVSVQARQLTLLLLDSMDGAPLHSTDTKASQQFLGHPDLWSLRHEHLAMGRVELERLKTLDLDNAGIFSSSCFWFNMLTYATSVKVARLLTTYNLHLIPPESWEAATGPEQARHLSLVDGTGRLQAKPSDDLPFRTAYFHVLHFLGTNKLWLEETERDYGADVARRLREDRRRLIRELFGTRALHRLPLEQRTLNLLEVYQANVGAGRMLFLPLKLFTTWLRLVGAMARLAAQSVRELLDPRVDLSRVLDNEAAFFVARRKLRRMKKPLLLEAIRLLARVDPRYLDLEEGGAEGHHEALWLRDLHLALVTPSERDEVEALRERSATRLIYLPGFLESWAEAPAVGTRSRRRLCASFAMDEGGVASFAVAQQRAQAWYASAQRGHIIEPPAGGLPRAKSGRLAAGRGLKALLKFLGATTWRERRRLKRALARDVGDLRVVCAAFGKAAPELPTKVALRLAAEQAAGAESFLRRQGTLRAIVVLLVADLLQHERLVWQVGGYEGQGPPAISVLGDVPTTAGA
ncbi:MAG: hypothetical protein JKY65_09830 [Planctomycetes bacterium]|nr:hypothetical protein [Planctomycetota bacterium]